ncbi:MAG: alpha/beta hydrolase [Chitinophagaceae bacterium]|nr:alpha/beta hydrolase [Chitinophagaceae bacterium]
MSTKNFSFQISPEIGEVSAVFIMPKKPVCMMTLAHGAGAGMDHSFMVELSHALEEKNIGTLRFNFPFMENKKGRPDLPAVAHKTIEAAIQQAKKGYPSLPLFLSGKSFGGRMSSQYVALHPDATVEGLIFYGFPLHPAKKPSVDRAEHLKKVKQSMLFLQGTRDALAEWHLIEEVCSSLAKATLLKIEGADHGFKKGKENLIPNLARQTGEWIDPLL